MKGKSNFGTKLLLVIILGVAMIHVAARGNYVPDPNPDPNPAPDSPAANTLRFPLKDRTGDPRVDGPANPFDLKDPSNVNRSTEYNTDDNRFYLTEKIGNEFYRNPSYLTFEEYQKYEAKQEEQNYWKRRLDALTLFNKQPTLPTMYKEGIFDRLFGNNTISVRPQGNVDVTVGGNWQNIQNPTLPQRQRKYGIFDFDLQMNINLLAQIGDKMKLNISNNTKPTFDYQNTQKLEYTGKEDEIIKKIEAGNISFPLNTTLISGVQSLFGLKTQLQFGKLWITAALSQQKSKRNSLTVQGGSQTQTFGIKADDYEENKHFLLGQYFKNNYNSALKNFPVISSVATISKIEVYVTNRTGATEGIRDVLCFMDLGEKTPFRPGLANPAGALQPDNRSNRLYERLLQNPDGRTTARATERVEDIEGGIVPNLTRTPLLEADIDYVRTSARKLNPSEFAYNPQLGYISLNTQVNTDDVLGVAYRYTYNGKVYQVGEFAEDLPPDTVNQKIMFLKLLKARAQRPVLPLWNLMMKNVYALGGIGVSREDFRFNILYQDPGGGEKRYIPDGPQAGVPLISLLNLDRLNVQNDPSPDGVFDYVEGITIAPQQGRIIFPVLEPFGEDLKPALGGDQQLERSYLYNILYDSTKTIARQFQQYNRFIMRGSYKSASSSEIFLGGFNIPPGSVSVTAGGQKLLENVDYQIDYGLGRLKILNTGVLNSGIPVNVAYEDNATFGFQQQNFMGARLDYYVNPKLILGGTFMRLTERPFSQKTTYGEDPIKNTVFGLDGNYSSEFPGLTKLLDKLPIYSTTAPSFITASAEGATLRPGHPKQINSLDPEGAVYIDDFEGTRSAYDLKFPSLAWSLGSVPVGTRDKFGNLLFPEASLSNNLASARNRAKLSWYNIEPSLVDPVGGIPDFVKNDSLNQHYIRQVLQQDVFPQRTATALTTALSTFDLTYYPTRRGPYNYDTEGITAGGSLTNPRGRWGGIMRPMDYSDFEQSNVEYIEFWMMDPFIGGQRPFSTGGSLYVNLGNVSEDINKDGRKLFENGIPFPLDTNKLESTPFGFVPRFQQQITRAFDNSNEARAAQDVGYDGLDNAGELAKFDPFLRAIESRYGATSQAYLDAQADPSTDDYRFYRDPVYDQPGNGSVLTRYRSFSNPHGNSPVIDANAVQSSAATTIPESEDIDRDNTLNETEDYYQYRLDLKPNMQTGSNYIVNRQVSRVKLPNGTFEDETWYQFKIPIRDYQQKVGNIGDFRSIRFMRMFLSDFQDSVTLRFAQINLGRNQWRRYNYSLKNPGEVIPDDEQQLTDFTVTSVSLEENSQRQPVNYVIPPGVNRQTAAQGNGQNIAQNEQALSLQVCALKDGDARAAFKEVNVDMRQFGRLRMFLHGESQIGQSPLRDGDVRAFVRIGSDFINNYYEYQVPLKITNPGSRSDLEIWPVENNMDISLEDLVAVKNARNNQNLRAIVPYRQTDAAGRTIVVVGNPNVGEAKTIMLGIYNPEKNASSAGDDGMAKCTEVWFNELRMTGLNETPGYAATAKVDLQLADLGSMHVGGSMHTMGYGNIDQKVNQRKQDNYYQYDANTNLQLGKLMPKSWGVQLPVYVATAKNVSTPKFNPYDLDVNLKEQLGGLDAKARDSLRDAAQDVTEINSINFSNVRITGNPEKANAKVKPWSAKNFDLSYAYNSQLKHNSTIEKNKISTNRLGLGYTYSIRSKPFEPFKSLIRSRSKWWGLIKDFNLTPLPSSIGFRSDMNRILEETKVRNLESDGGYDIPSTYYKNFTWLRTYTLRWELTKSLSFDYNASNISRIDEPYGKVDNKEKQDSLWKAISRFGRNTFFTQALNVAYKVPFAKLPLTDWISLNASYGSTYSWTAASRLAESLGNTIVNTQTKTLNGELNFTQLYNKNKFLRAVNQPKRRAPKNNKATARANDRKEKDGDTKNAKNGLASGKNEMPNPDIETKPETNTNPVINTPKKGERPSTLNLNGVLVSTASMSDPQLDSLIKLIKAEDIAKAKAARAKAKQDRKIARRNRRNQPANVSDLARAGGRLLTMVKRATINYSENGGTVLPGYMDSTRVFGVNTIDGEPGLGFAFGGQPATSYLDALSGRGRISRDSLFNAQFQQTYSQNLNITGQIEPVPNDLRIDVTLTKTFLKSHTEIYKDTTSSHTGLFTHNNPYETGNYNVSYIGLKTLFQSGGVNAGAYQEFLTGRKIVSRRLGNVNPYTNGLTAPNDPEYQKGYGRFSQDALIPAFIAAYSGRNAEKIPLLDYSNQSISSNPFHNYYPLPNWRINYSGLSKIPLFSDLFTNFVVNDAYTGNLSVSSFSTALYYQDAFGVGFPSFLDSISGNYVPFFQVPNITISEQFGPLIGVDASLRNGLTTRIEYRKNRTVSLSLIDYQISETHSSEFVIGAGFRIRGLRLPFEVLGVKKLDNDLNIKLDLGFRDDKTSNTYLAQDYEVVTRGQKVITISPSVDYIVNDRITLRFFYDRRQSIPYTTQSYPTTTTKAGLTLRFIFAQ